MISAACSQSDCSGLLAQLCEPAPAPPVAPRERSPSQTFVESDAYRERTPSQLLAELEAEEALYGQ